MPENQLPNKTEMPTPAPSDKNVTTSAPVEALKFYCAFNAHKLQISCSAVIQCTGYTTVCRNGQGCIHHECDQPSNYFNAGICPIDFVGFTSNQEMEVKYYVECSHSVMGKANTCGRDCITTFEYNFADRKTKLMKIVMAT